MEQQIWKHIFFSHQYLIESFSLWNETGINKVGVYFQLSSRPETENKHRVVRELKLWMLPRLLHTGRGNLEFSSSGIPSTIPKWGRRLGSGPAKNHWTFIQWEAENNSFQLLPAERAYHKLHTWRGKRYTHISPLGPRLTIHWLRDRNWNTNITGAGAPRDQYKTWFWNGKRSGSYNAVNQKVVKVEVNKIQKYKKNSYFHISWKLL